MKIKNPMVFLVLAIITILFAPLASQAQETQPDPNFDPAYIISDDEILSYNSMTADDIQKFLESQGSYLANYSANDPDGNKFKISQIIYDRCQANKINPKFVLVLLQKEEGLIEDPSPSQSRLDWAAGYGCPDSGGCNVRWQGIWKQINSATLQFYDYIENPSDYTYQKGQTYVFENKYSTTLDGDVTVTPRNNATAALYNYTPHVYNGNYNFWKLWRKYFTKLYSDGSLLQAKGDKVIYLLEDGKKRPFASRAVLASRFDENKIITVDKSVLATYYDGAPIKFPNYSLIKSPRGTIFLLVDNTKRGFTSNTVFKTFGYNKAEVMSATWDDINSYEDGVPLTPTSNYPTGALLQDAKTGGIYFVYADEKHPLLDKALLTYKFKDKKIIKSTQKILDGYTTTDPILFDDGELLTSTTNNGIIYLIANDKKRAFSSTDSLIKLGYKLENVIKVSPQLLAKYENGENIQ